MIYSKLQSNSGWSGSQVLFIDGKLQPGKNMFNSRMAVAREPHVKWIIRDPATGFVWCAMRKLRMV